MLNYTVGGVAKVRGLCRSGEIHHTVEGAKRDRLEWKGRDARKKHDPTLANADCLTMLLNIRVDYTEQALTAITLFRIR
jgi:hypothetical protein